jgi:hypothetical protein
MLQKPQLFLDLNSVLGRPPHRQPDTLHEALFAGEVDEEMLQVWMSRMQARVAPCAMGHVDVQLAQYVCDAQASHADSWRRALDVLVPAFLVQTTGHSYGQQAHIFRKMGHADYA